MADQEPSGLTAGEGAALPDELDPPEAHERSLTDDLAALFEDGKTYAEAEFRYQQSRAAFAADRGRSGAIYAVAALTLVWLALVALVVGLVIALTPEVGPWAATAIVVLALATGGAFFGWRARQRFARMSAAFQEPRS